MILIFGKPVLDLTASSFSADSCINSWPDSQIQRVASKPYPTDYWRRAYLGCVEQDEIKDQEIYLAHKKWKEDPANKYLVELLRDEKNNVKYGELQYYLDLDNVKILELTSAIILDQCFIEGKPVDFDVYSVAGRTAEHILKRLFLLISKKQSSFNKNELFGWVKLTYEKLFKVNMHIACHFIVILKELKIITSERFCYLNKKALTILNGHLKNKPNSYKQLMKLIPENNSGTLCLCLYGEDNSQDFSSSFDSLGEVLLKSLQDPETEKKAFSQVMTVLFSINGTTVTLIEKRLNFIFNECKKEVLNLIDKSDALITKYSEPVVSQIKKIIK